MSSLPNPSQDGQSLQDTKWCPANQEELSRILDCAFDYRGDVTIELKSGESVEGYVFRQHTAALYPYIEIFIEEWQDPRKIEFQQIVAIHFSGEDTALGKSWETWIKKKQEGKATHNGSSA